MRIGRINVRFGSFPAVEYTTRRTAGFGGDLNRSMQHFILDSQDGVIAMKRKYKRIGFTAAQKAERWDRWQKGEGLKSIGRAFGKNSSSIYRGILLNNSA
jgi:hypothetical protein